MSIYTHKHHIVPRHAGGTDDPSNLVELTIEEHAQAHLELYEKYGRWQDQVAHQALLGNINKEEARILSVKKANTGRKQSEEHVKKRTASRMNSCPQPSLGKTWTRTSESKDHMSNLMKGRYVGELNPRYGAKHSTETISKMSETAKNRPRFPCSSCGRMLQKANLSQHQKICKSSQPK
jgi:hypothetical protein